MRERDHPHAEPVEQREQLDVRPDPLRALERDEQSDPPVVDCHIDLRAGPAELHLRRLRRLAFEGLELEERRAQRSLRDLRRDIDRKHLHVDAARARLGNPTLAPVAVRTLLADPAVAGEAGATEEASPPAVFQIQARSRVVSVMEAS